MVTAYTALGKEFGIDPFEIPHKWTVAQFVLALDAIQWRGAVEHWAMNRSGGNSRQSMDSSKGSTSVGLEGLREYARSTGQIERWQRKKGAVSDGRQQ